MSPILSGIQQIGIGVPDVSAAFRWYRGHLGLDVPIFDETAEAPLMVRYTAGRVHQRRAILAINLAGGGGVELWQYQSRTPESSPVPIRLGDCGIIAARVKARQLPELRAQLLARSPDLVVTDIRRDPGGGEHFFVRDPFGNLLDIARGEQWFGRRRSLAGGIAGGLIGVSEVDRSLALYRDVLGYDRVVYDREGRFDDFVGLPGGDEPMRRVLLAHSAPRVGRFSRLLGPSTIELIQTQSRTPRRIFDGRLWGDLGFIHLCFDVTGMDALRDRCEACGFPFTIDSQSSFSMASASGRFAYLEDPDGTLIEMVETHRVPILKKLGIHLNLRRHDPGRPLPDWMIKLLALGRVRD